MPPSPEKQWNPLLYGSGRRGGDGGCDGGEGGGGEGGGGVGGGGEGGGGDGGGEGLGQVTEAQWLAQRLPAWAAKFVWVLSLLQSLKAELKPCLPPNPLNIPCATRHTARRN